MNIQLQLLARKIPLSAPVRPVALQSLRKGLERFIPPRPRITIPYEDNYQSFVETLRDNIFAPYKNKELRVALLKNNKLVHEFTVQNRGSFKNDILPQFYEDYQDQQSFLPNIYNADKILIFTPKQLEGIKLEQVFKDSPNSICVFQSIIKKFDDLPEAKTKKTEQNRRSRLNKVLKVQEEYPNGVQQSQLPEIAEKCNVKIVLQDVLNNEIQEYGTARQIVVNITNTRKDHVDYLTSKEPAEVTQEEMNQLYQQVKQSNEHYVIKNSTTEIKHLQTIHGTYIVPNPDQELFNQLNNQIKDASFDALKYPELNDFTKAGRIINSAPLVFQPFNEHTKLYDMKNAYTKHDHCPFYEGFLHQIQQFRSTNKIIQTGIYQFKVLKDHPFSRAFGIHQDNLYILPSPEIKYWQKYITLQITAGCWGNKTNIHYSNEVVNKKIYQRWTGKLSTNDNYRSTKYTFPTTQEFAQHLKTIYPETYYWDDQKASIHIPNKTVKVNHHIFAFITSYTRINMLLQIEKTPNVQAILLDGIYTDQLFPSNPLFVEKPVEVKEYDYSLDWYEPTLPFHPPPIHLINSSFLSGSGGTGKTHSILKDKGYINPLYVTPTHELGQTFQNYTTIHKLIGHECTPYKDEYPMPPVILIDEATMIHKDFIEKALHMYSSSLIFVAGDIDENQHYQCRSGNPTNYWEIFKPKDVLPIVSYTTDYRAKTELLKNMKMDFRNYMKEIYTDGGLRDTKEMKSYIQKHYKTITLQEASALAKPTDIFMWSTHRIEQQIPSHLKVKCAGTLDNYINPKLQETTKRGVHAYQGKTIPYPTKIFITLDFFEYAMPYTAISRATHHQQIYFVEI